MEEPSFSEVVDWLAAREGKEVYIEVGMKDPTLEANDFFPIAIHATLEKPDIGEDLGHEGRGLVYVKLRGGERDRLYIDKTRVTKTHIDAFALKLVFHDSIYLAIAGS